MDTIQQPTSERRTGAERRRNTAVAVNPMMFDGPAVVVPRRISWGAIAGGVVLALVVQLTTSLLGLATGLSTNDGRPGLVTAIWMVASAVIALFVGGAAASRLAGVERRADGVVHGLLTWGLMALVAFFLVTTVAGRLVSFSTNDLTEGLSRIGSGTAASVDPLTERMKDVAALNDANGGVSDIAPRPEPVSPDNPVPTIPAGTAAFWAFVALCVGAFSAALGGWAGAPLWQIRRRRVLVA